MDTEAATIACVLEQRAQDRPHAPSFVFGDQSSTYGELREDVVRIAGMLLHDGIGSGDRVALCMPAGLDLVRLFYALQRIEAVPCIFDPHVPDATTARRIARIRPVHTLAAIPFHGTASPLPRLSDDAQAVAFLQFTSGTPAARTSHSSTWARDSSTKCESTSYPCYSVTERVSSTILARGRRDTSAFASSTRRR